MKYSVGTLFNVAEDNKMDLIFVYNSKTKSTKLYERFIQNTYIVDSDSSATKDYTDLFIVFY